MISHHARRFVFIVLLISLTVFSQIVAAQDENRERIFTDELQSETPELKLETVREKVHFGGGAEDSGAWRNDFQTSRVFGKSISEQGKDVMPIEEKPQKFYQFDKAKIKSVGAAFDFNGEREKQIGFEHTTINGEKKFSFRPQQLIADSLDETKDLTIDESFRWGSATRQTLMFLAIQHGYAFTQQKTREALKGKFWKDYVKSIKSLHGWADGGRFFTNYIAHPMQGSFLGFIQVQNDPKGLKQQFGSSKDYWRSRLKAMAWSAAWSTQFEIGPVSQASIGNVGLKGKQTYIDIVVTPTVGTAWLIGEDAIDRFIMKRIERGTKNFYVRIFARMLLNPTRTVSNVFRFKEPWYRDRPVAR